MSLWAGVAVLGFAMVFSVPRRTLPGIVALAIGAHLVRTLFMNLHAGLPTSSFMAALFVGFTAAIIAPRTGQATPIYAFAPVIPLIPGTYLFNSLRAGFALTAAQAPADTPTIVDAAMISAATATLTIIALAVGAIGPTLLAGRSLAKFATGRDDASAD